ncbi:hypothetical protein BDZ89DRAFT_1080906, partial [Hymenopellis radicata]
MPTASKVSAMPSNRSSVELDPLDYASSHFVDHRELLEDWRQKGPETNRAHGDRPVRRPSFRLMVVHVLHATLLLISILTLLISFFPMGAQRLVSQVTSTITIMVQIFFTASISLLYLLSSDVAIDAAIRHPRSIIDLDYRLQAWYGGVGPSVINGIFHMHRFRKISRSVLLGIPLYFIAGEMLKLTSSSVLGVNVYNVTTLVDGPAGNHLVPFAFPNLVHSDHEPYNCSDVNNITFPFYKVQDLWKVSKQILRLDLFDNETTHPGLIGNVLYDIPDSSRPFDKVNVNGTKMNVHCSHVKPEDSVFQLQSPADDAPLSGPSDNYYLNYDVYNITWNLNLLLQSWSFDDWRGDDDGYKGISNQVLMVLAAPDSDLLLHDATGSVASVNVTSLISTDDCQNACSSNNLNEASAECVDYFRDHSECIAESSTWHFQALGCTLRTTKAELSFNSAGFLVGDRSQAKPSNAHAWDDFLPVNARDGNDFLANEFLEMFVPAPCSTPDDPNYQDLDVMSDVLLNILAANHELAFFENVLANMTASFLWNVWQLCDKPFEYGHPYLQCQPRPEGYTSMLATGTARYNPHETRARLQIVQWKAAVTVLCGIALFVLAFYLLGTVTDSRAGVPLREARFLETSRLLKDSSIPDIVRLSAPGFDQTPLRYVRVGSEESTAAWTYA